MRVDKFYLLVFLGVNGWMLEREDGKKEKSCAKTIVEHADEQQLIRRAT